MNDEHADMPDPKVTDGDAGPAAPLSWRDVYKAVGDSEARVIKAVQDAVAPLTTGQADHEARIRIIEAAVQPIAALTADRERRLSAVELEADTTAKQVQTFLDREKGIFSTLGATRTFFITMAVVASPVISILAIIIAENAK